DRHHVPEDRGDRHHVGRLPAGVTIGGSMTSKAAELAQKILRRPFEELTERERLVIQSIVDRSHLTRHAGPGVEELTRGQRAADRIARFGGSWTFIAIF